MVSTFGRSERKACQLVNLSRSTNRYRENRKAIRICGKMKSWLININDTAVPGSCIAEERRKGHQP